ncbi:MAG: NAD-dependent epimerase/dehydratase family protein [Acidaminococcus sp.]|jgi:dihydroflavonol-4-reductase|nr:NAD-dependent epimerase/dehydratase family protein [Acidaminococcus sp.]MCI2099391.1 NAD-dependent epimerase/dehydratase family protein [Acidaminococcus sp.]MCI2113751.1 NAD-dependent epimerase/dehydratase family protein [Acidaminococcus sp.]MCI2115675.1 NAD-dependent epimerase/dehydratase family protein [Acidaminococcus sp.]
MSEKVLLTGADGYLAGFTIKALLEAGYEVTGTVRSDDKARLTRDVLSEMQVPNLDKLSFVQADIREDAGWAEAMQGVNAVIHMAHPTPGRWNLDGHEKIDITADGVHRVMQAAHDAGIKRVILTSCAGAVNGGHEHHDALFTEEDWSDLSDNGIPVDYDARAKMKGEQTAWDFAEENQMELTSILPSLIIGPALGDSFSRQSMIIQAMLMGQLSHLLQQSFNYVDVRDVAAFHVLVLQHPETVGQRYIVSAEEYVSYKQMAMCLKERLGDKATKVPTKELSNFAAKVLSLLVTDLRMPVKYLGRNTALSAAKAEKELGWKARIAYDVIGECAEEIIRVKGL